jgi:hypothetical protein
MRTHLLPWRSVALVPVLLAGCATRQPVQFPDPQAPVEDPQKARIYVMRDPNFWRFNLVSLLPSADICPWSVNPERLRCRSPARPTSG